MLNLSHGEHGSVSALSTVEMEVRHGVSDRRCGWSGLVQRVATLGYVIDCNVVCRGHDDKRVLLKRTSLSSGYCPVTLSPSASIAMPPCCSAPCNRGFPARAAPVR